MKQRVTLSVLVFLLIPFVMLNAQTMSMKMKAAYSFPTIDQDSLLAGLKSVRNVTYHADPLGEGVAAFAATNYFEGGVVSVFKNAGDDAMELVYTTPVLDSLGGNSSPRFVRWGDLDNDGIIELLFHSNRNGIVIFEWDGVPGSWNFGDAPAKIIGPPDIPTANATTTEHLSDVMDFDGDGDNEIAFALNSSPNANDRAYVFSIIGQYQSGNPGFSASKKELELIKDQLPYSSYGGGTPWLVVAGNLDGQGNPELLVHNWNFGHVTPVRVTGADTYVLADTTNDKHFYYTSKSPHDNVAYMGAFATDVDGDNRDEVYLPYFYNDNRPFPGVVGMVHWENGSSLSEIDSSNVVLFDISSVNNGDNIFGAGYGDYDNDGKVNLYFSGGYGHVITTMEFQEGDKTDPNNWTMEVLYTGVDNDIDRYGGMIIYDSLGTRDTTFLVGGVSYFASKIAAENCDFDRDGLEDMILGHQAFVDSHQVMLNVWDEGSSKYVTQPVYNEANPHRWSIRMIESTLTGFVKKDLKVIMPSDYVLEQNYPNPFNPTTNIQFYLPLRKRISLTIYNAIGQKVKTLVDNQLLSQGTHELQWDATNDQGQPVASGMYLYELRFGNFSHTKRMMFLK